MPKEQLLSAVAKRRGLNGNVAGIVGSVSTSRAQSPAAQQPGKDSKSLPKSQIQTVVDHSDDEGNPFSALVEKDIVQFSGFREIERLSSQSLRIRLSRGQQCFISGRYYLWIKDGLVEYQGATLEMSTRAHPIYAPAPFETPAVLALSNVVEIEVYSIETPGIPCFGVTLFQWKPQAGDVIFTVSFWVHGYSEAIENNPPALIKASDYGFWKDITRQISLFQPSNRPKNGPTILLCGRQFAGPSTCLYWMLNGIITNGTRPRSKHSNPGILLLDLDSDAPVIGLPGTANLVYISQPLLGVSFVNPVSRSGSFKIIKTHYLIRNDDPKQYNDQLDYFLKDAKHVMLQAYQHCPLIIRANDWLESIDSDQIETLAKGLAPDFVLCNGPETGSNSGQLGKMIGSRYGAHAFISVPMVSTKGPSSSVNNELMLQSYFHSRGWYSNRPSWSSLPLELDAQSQIWLSYGNENAFVRSIAIPVIPVEGDDLMDVLDGCMVAIVLQKSRPRLLRQDGPLQGQPEDDVSGHGKTAAPIPEGGDYLGYGLVGGFDQGSKEICLITPISKSALDIHKEQGDQIRLIAAKADAEGGFDTAWVQLELGASVPGGKATKPINRRKLNIRQMR